MMQIFDKNLLSFFLSVFLPLLSVKSATNSFCFSVFCFTTTMIATRKVNVSTPNLLVVASMDKMLHDDYLCLVESGKQQIKKARRKFNRKTRKQRQLL